MAKPLQESTEQASASRVLLPRYCFTGQLNAKQLYCLFFFTVVSGEKQPEDVLFPKHKYLLSVRPKPSVPQRWPISLSHSCSDDSSALNDACFQFRVSSLLWGLLL